MRQILMFASLFLYSVNSLCQNQDSKLFVQNYFGTSARLMYKDRLHNHYINDMKDALNRDTLYSLNGIVPDLTKLIVLTPEERIYINQALSKMANIRWERDLFKYGKVIQKDSVESFFMNYKGIVGSVHVQGYKDKLYEFSDPIFIRDNTLCIFYTGYSCAYECGQGGLVIYRREKGNWAPWLKLYSWMS